MEKYFWDIMPSKKTIVETIKMQKTCAKEKVGRNVAVIKRKSLYTKEQLYQVKTSKTKPKQESPPA